MPGYFQSLWIIYRMDDKMWLKRIIILITYLYIVASIYLSHAASRGIIPFGWVYFTIPAYIIIGAGSTRALFVAIKEEDIKNNG